MPQKNFSKGTIGKKISDLGPKGIKYKGVDLNFVGTFSLRKAINITAMVCLSSRKNSIKLMRMIALGNQDSQQNSVTE